MQVLHVEKLKFGTEKQVKDTFKPFSLHEWLMTSSDGTQMAGIATLPSLKHAAAFAKFLEDARFSPPTVTLPALDLPESIESVTAFPFAVLLQRVRADMAKWGLEQPPKLDGTVAKPSDQLRRDLLGFRQSAIIEREKLANSTLERALMLLQSAHAIEDLESKFPDWDTAWASFLVECRSEEIQAGPVGNVQDFDVRQKEKEIERRLLEQEAKEREQKEQAKSEAPRPTPRELVVEYFGEADDDLVAMIEGKLDDPKGLAEALKELLEDETDEFVEKLIK